MPAPVQRSFVQGEVSPTVHARADLQAYQHGLDTCRNFVVMKTGGVESRPGTEYCGTTKDNGIARLWGVWFDVDAAYVLEFGNRLAELKRPMWLRYVLVPGLTDIPEEMEAVADYGASLGVVERVEILPFHQMGKYKWERLGLDYKLADTDPPTREGVAKAVAIFREAGLVAD